MPRNLVAHPRPFSALAIRAGILSVSLILWYAYATKLPPDSSLNTLAGLFITIIAINMFYIMAAVGVVFFYRKRRRLSHDTIDNFVIGIHKISGVAFWFTVSILLIDALLINIQELVTSIAIFAALIGIVFKEHILNFINAIIIMFSGSFRLGEFVKLGETKGKIVDITFTHTRLLTDSTDFVYVPNNTIFTKDAVNYSRNAVKNIHIELTVHKSAFGQYEALYNTIVTRVLEAYPDVVSGEDGVRLHIESIGSENIVWRLEFMTNRYNFTVERHLRNLVAQTAAEFYAALPVEEKK